MVLKCLVENNIDTKTNLRTEKWRNWYSELMSQPVYPQSPFLRGISTRSNISHFTFYNS